MWESVDTTMTDKCLEWLRCPRVESGDPIQTDSEFIARACAGDRVAWQAFVERYSSLVWSIVRRGGLTREEGEDVFQDVFAAALAALPKLRDGARVDAWLATTTRRTVWKVWSVRRRAGEAIPEDLVGVEERPDQLSEALEVRMKVRQGLDAISLRCRELLLAAFAQGPPPNYDQLALQLGLPRGSLGPTRARCLEQLASVLMDLGIGENRQR